MDFARHPHFAPFLAVIAAVLLLIAWATRGGCYPEHTRGLVVMAVIVGMLAGTLRTLAG